MHAFARLAARVPDPPERPAVVAITGAVAAGKSTAAANLAGALAPRSAVVVATDGFLMTNAELAARGATGRKGEPDTYDVDALAAMLDTVRGGRPTTAPVYSHLAYDRVAGVHHVVAAADVIVLEGLHLLHDRFATVRRALDLSVFLDADDADLETWYLDRLRALVDRARRTPGAFDGFRDMGPDQVERRGREVWHAVNRPNNERFVRPTRERAEVVLVQGPDHAVIEMRAGADGAAPSRGP